MLNYRYSVLILTLILGFSLPSIIVGQSKYQTFKDTRVINSQSVETLKKGKLDFRIGHRFGDVNGGWTTFIGFESAADVLFEFDYGLTDNFMVGIMRAKGADQLKQNVSTLAKFRILRQGDRSPFSLAFSGLWTISTMAKSDNPGRINFFEKFAHRISYNFQMILASKVSERFSLQVAPQFTYRNIVPTIDRPVVQDKNVLPSISAAMKFQFTKVFALIVDATVPFSEYRRIVNEEGERDFHYPFGVGFEWETGGGHVFQFNLTNAKGIIETDYIPYTRSSWGDGEYRIGFTIARQFNL